MKKLFVLSLLAMFMITGFYSCKKYEDGPLLSLRSKSNRLEGKWKISKATNEGLDVTDQYEEYYFTFNDDKTYEYTRKLLKETGTWAFDDDKENIILTIDGTSTTETFKIIRLKNSELTLDRTVQNQTTRFYYIADE